LSLTCDECIEAFRSVGTARGHAVTWYRDTLKHGHPAHEPDCRVPEEFTWDTPAIDVTVEQDGVVKIVFRLVDAARVEAVVIPAANRTTLCVSSQAGCRMGCKFCCTGTQGFIRNLNCEEIVGQVFAARHDLGHSIDNIVFMGMGEPLDNITNVVQAIRVMSDPRGFDIAPRHITVSTAGLPEGIRYLGSLALPGLCMAISLNAANDDLRTQLMPVNRSYPLAVLKQALQEYPLKKKGVFFIEYVLLKGVNDSPGHAAELIRFLEDLPVRVNVIAYNSGFDDRFMSPSIEDCQQFCALIADAGVFVRLRSSRGHDIRAACGQLGTGVS